MTPEQKEAWAKVMSLFNRMHYDPAIFHRPVTTGEQYMQGQFGYLFDAIENFVDTLENTTDE